MHSLEADMRAVFDALGRDDMDDLISYWAEDGIYFNPAAGPAAEGAAKVKETVGALAKRLKANGEELVVDRVTLAADAEPRRLIAEWHVQGGARDGKLGVHVVLFNPAGKLHRVTVFSHP